MKLLLIDLSSLFRPIWEMRSSEADTDYASMATVAKIHELASGFDGCAIACDSRKNWRKDIYPEYKAQRPKQEEPMYHQLGLAKEQLAADGFPVWEAEGYEADDVIGSACEWLDAEGHLEGPDALIVIESGDKDMAQLVGSRVHWRSSRSGTTYDIGGVMAKFGVLPEATVDWLCLVGDSADNVPGIKGIGAKTATALLQEHGSLFELYSKLGDSCDVLGLTPSLFTRLKDGIHAVEMARKLITLRTDIELPFADIFKPRVAKEQPKASWDAETEKDDMQTVDGEIIDEATGEVTPAALETKKEGFVLGSENSGAPTKFERLHLASAAKEKSTAIVPVEWAQSLEPQNLSSAMTLAKAAAASKLFQAYGSPEAVLMTIMTGRALGIDTPTALRSIHIIDGKPTMSASLMAALVLRSRSCKQFEITERTNERATIRIWREGWEKPKDISYSIDDAKRAGRVKDGSGWVKNPADMCVARCQAIGARLGWPDILANVYLPDELGREEAA